MTSAINAEAFQTLVAKLPVGKRLPQAIYLHKSALEQTSKPLHTMIEDSVAEISFSHGEPDGWNVIKLHRDRFRITLLHYPRFFEDAYPALRHSVSIDLGDKRCRITRYDTSDNPPILHRKEVMVLPEHPAYEEFRMITEEGEQAGLYDNASIIGFRKTWETLIAERGYTLVDGRLFRRAAVEPVNSDCVIERHRTALSRDRLSVPMKSLARNGYLNGDYSVFDYGCGRGDDLRELEAHGVAATGWDPNWRPDGIKVDAELVNLGYVINVIEDLDERVDALLGAWRLTQRLLVVSAMLASESMIRRFKPYKDGVVTSRNTFQKYFSQGELQVFIEQVLDEEPIAV